MSDVSCPNALIRVSQNGWRRPGSGRMLSLEMSSMLPRAREVLREAGIDEESFLAESELPVGLHEMLASRVPVAGGRS